MADDLAQAPVAFSDVVTTSNGPIRGSLEDGLTVFRGVRYGAPPTRSRRFQPPERPAPWTATADTVRFGAPAIQAGLAPGERRSSPADPPAPDEPASSEDCLFLNVWTPGLDTARRPTMVWLHGGGFANGSGGAAMYDGAALARRGDTVVVTLNHRLNVFGYLHLGEVFGPAYARSGVAGMLDIVLALEWVRDNIAAFGGDPTNVTIFGESGGGWKVSLLMAMPAARGLFAKAVIQSGPGLTAKPTASATKVARAVLTELGVATAEQLLAVDAATLSRASVKAGDALRLYAPVLDGDVIPRHPFEPDASPLNADVPILIGTNKDEAALFLFSHPRFGSFTEEDVAKAARKAVGERADALIAAVRRAFPDYSLTHQAAACDTVGGMWAGSIKLAERKAAQGAAPVFMYLLTWETPVARGRLRSAHAIEIPLVFDNVEKARNFVGRGDDPQILAEQMSEAWLAFARTGDPGWPAYDADDRTTKIFDVQSRVEHDPYAELRVIVQG